MVDGERFTLKSIPKGPFTDKEDDLKELIDYAQKNVNIGTVYVDRAFFTVDCIKILKQERVNLLMPATKNKRVK